MIAKVTIKGNKIADVVVRDGDRILKTDWSDNAFVWGKRWSVSIGYEGIICTSSRTAKGGGKNVVEYVIKYDGTAKSTLRTGDQIKIIKVSRVFKTPGNFDGTLNLVYNENGHRWGDFFSDELAEFLAARSIDFIIRKDPDEFKLEIRGRNVSSECTKNEGVSSYATALRRRVIETDGDLSVDSNDERIVVSIDAADWLVLQQKHVTSGKMQRTLFTMRSFCDLVDSIPLFDKNKEITKTTNSNSESITESFSWENINSNKNEPIHCCAAS